MEKPIKRVVIIYDGECPFCSSYVSHVRLRDVVDDLNYIDARGGGDVVAEAKQRGFDLDDGMLVIIDGAYYHGGEALNVLANLTSPIDTFNRLNASLLASKKWSTRIYPILRFGRNLTLRLLGRKKLRL